MFKLLAVALSGVILWRLWEMEKSLRDAVDGLVAEVQDSQGKLESIKTFIEGVPALAAAAVAEALANQNVEEQAAAAEIEAARTTVSDKVDAALDAINANPAPGETGNGEPTGEPPAEEPPAEPTA